MSEVVAWWQEFRNVDFGLRGPQSAFRNPQWVAGEARAVRKLSSILAVLATLAPATPVRAHHGVAAVSIAGPEGPGAGLETTSALPLPQGLLFGMLKTEYVPFRKFGFAEPQNKSYSSFNMVAVGYGIRPWLSAYVFQPYNLKAQDEIGQDANPGDTNLMLSVGFKYDEGLKLVPEKESLDELMDWHFSVWVSSTLPVGPTTAKDNQGEYFAPDMQTGFGEPSPAVGAAVLKQLSEDFTFLADTNYQHFFPHTYPFTRYQFGGETRLNGALVYRAYGSGRFRFDVAAELNGLHLQRDRERDASGAMESLRASGGVILYAGLGLRAIYGPTSVGFGIRKAALKDLNEQADQQGSEGLEEFRAAFTVSGSIRF